MKGIPEFNMIIRASEQFAKLFTCSFEDAAPDAGGFGGVWYAETRLLSPFGRFVIFSEATTLFTILIQTGSKRAIIFVINEFERRLQSLPERGKASGIKPVKPFPVAKRVDKRVIGSQNDLLHLLEANLYYEARPLTPSGILEIESRLNNTPMSFLQMKTPVAAFRDMVAKMA